jgi:ubiquinone/menaquinone biosynthesis C-methylase UbiE
MVARRKHVTQSERGQVILSAAEVYEDFFVPALFQEWTGRVIDAAHIQTGQRVLDVACGTGVLARAAAHRVGATGSVVGVDINQGMLAVVKRKGPSIEWRHGRAEALPFDNDSFDAVVSQFGLMFFEDRQAAIRDMVRVLRPGGRLAVAVWDSLDNTPGYAAMVGLLQRLFGQQAADGIRGPYVLGKTTELQPLFSIEGIKETEITTLEGTARFPSIESWVYTDIKGWVLADMLDDTQFELLVKEAKLSLSSFVNGEGVNGEGSVAFSAPAHIVSAVKV